MQIEEETQNLRQAEGDPNSKQASLEDLEVLAEQIRSCKVILSEEDYINTLQQKVDSCQTTLQELLESRADLNEFKELQNRIDELPIVLPEIKDRLKEVIEQTNAISVRIQLLKQASINSKLDSTKVEGLLQHYNQAPARLQEGQELMHELMEAQETVQQAQSALENEEMKLQDLNLIGSKLDRLRIHMGHQENALRAKIWKRRIQQIQNEKVPFHMLTSWYNEGLTMKEFDLTSELETLEEWVNRGERIKEKLLKCQTMEELDEVVQQASNEPYDLKQVIIEKKTRIQFQGESKPQAKAPEKERRQQDMPSLPQKRTVQPTLKEEFDYGGQSGDSFRKNYIYAIEKLMRADPTFKRLPEYHKLARKIALKLEQIIYQKGTASYNIGIKNIQKVLENFLQFTSFGKKIYKGEIKPEQLTSLEPDDCTNADKIIGIFKQTPQIRIVLRRDKAWTRQIGQPQKRQRVEQPTQKAQKTIPKTSVKELLERVSKPEPPKPAPLKQTEAPAPRASFNVSSLISEINEFNKKQEPKPAPVKKDEPVISASERIRRAQQANSQLKPQTDEDWKEMRNYRLEMGGFKPSEGPQKRENDGIFDVPPVKRGKYDTVEGQFSSDDDQEPLYGEKDKDEYNVIDIAQRADYSKKRRKSKAKRYDPFAANAPKNKAPIGSLLKIWNGRLDYNKHPLNVEIQSIENIANFQSIPQLPHKLTIVGRTKQSELELYIASNTNNAITRTIITGWLQATGGHDREFADLFRDLREKERAAVIRVDASLTIYLSNLTESFIQFLDNHKINVNQRMDNNIRDSLPQKDRLACIIFFKKGTASNQSKLMDPEVLMEADPSYAAQIEDQGGPGLEMSPITSEEEIEDEAEPNDLEASIKRIQEYIQEVLEAVSTNSGNFQDKLQKVQSVIEDLTSDQLQELKRRNPEILEAIEQFNSFFEPESSRTAAPVQNVSQFLSQPSTTRYVPPSYNQPPYNYRNDRRPPYQP